jgi:hypothetical protein
MISKPEKSLQNAGNRVKSPGFRQKLHIHEGTGTLRGSKLGQVHHKRYRKHSTAWSFTNPVACMKA